MQEILDEKESLEKELRAVQIELRDTLSLNFELIRENKKKDIKLKQLGTHLADLKEQHSADLQQYDLERIHCKEKYEYELTVHETKCEHLSLQKKR